MAGLGQTIGRWISSLKRREELDKLGPAEVNRIAADAGTSVGELYALESTGPDAARLLPRRLELLGIDRNALLREEPATLRDLERVCSLCGHKTVCEHDMDRTVVGDDWKTYCPNAQTLRALRN